MKRVSLALNEPGGPNVFDYVAEAFRGADHVGIAVSYVQESGWRILEPIVPTGSTRMVIDDQMGITQPSAIRIALENNVADFSPQSLSRLSW